MKNIEELEKIKLLLQKMYKSQISPSEYRELQYLLIRNEEAFRECYPLAQTNISGDKIMYISDTHIGGKEEDQSSLTIAYNTSLKQNIKTVIHAGDLIEACANKQYDKSKDVVEGELEKALSLMPEEITTQLLLGNHDYSAIRTYPSVIPLFFSDPKLQILGMQRVLLNWDDVATIHLNHKITQLRHSGAEDKGVIQLFGHYHVYQYSEYERSILLPPICNDGGDQEVEELKKYGLTLSLKSKPTFVISSIQDENTMLFELYRVTRDTHILEDCSERIEVNCKTRRIKKY